MLEYSQLLKAVLQAEELVYIYSSDIDIEILKHTYPYVIRISHITESHTFRIVKARNLNYFKRILTKMLVTQ